MNTSEKSIFMEVWQPEISSQPRETTLEELKTWINDGKLFPTSKVRIKNLNWIEAQQVPAFKKIFESNGTTLVNSHQIHNSINPESIERSVAPQRQVSPNAASFKIYSDTTEKCPPIHTTESNKAAEPKKTEEKVSKLEEKVEKIEEKPKSSPPKPLKSEKKIQDKKNKIDPTAMIKNILIFSAGCCLIFIFAWVGSYLWVYQLRSPLKVDEKSITQLVVLDNKFETDRIGLRLKISASEQNNQETSAPKTDFTQELAKMEKQYAAQRKMILENYRNEAVINDFNNFFYGSFIVLMILFLLVRIFTSNKLQPVHSIPTKSFVHQTEDATIDIDSKTDDIHKTNISDTHSTKSPDLHQTNPLDLHTTTASNKIETIDEFLQNPEYLNYGKPENITYCLMHRDSPATFQCEACNNNFCDECPKTVGSLENCCPFCKISCKSLESTTTNEKGQQVIIKYITEEKAKKEIKTIENFTIYDYEDEKKRKLGVISAFLISLCFSSSMSYFWVYEIAYRLEQKEIVQNVDTNGQQNSDISNVANSSETVTNTNVANSNVNQTVVKNDEPCIDPQTNEKFECDEETRRALHDHTEKTKSVADAKKQVKEKTNSILGLIIPSDEATENVENKPIDPAELERKENNKRKFLQLFGISFVALFGFLMGVVYLNKRKSNDQIPSE